MKLICESCEGLGEWEEGNGTNCHEVVCPDCDGTGRIEIEFALPEHIRIRIEQMRAEERGAVSHE